MGINTPIPGPATVAEIARHYLASVPAKLIITPLGTSDRSLTGPDSRLC
jgi:hypothetical protein